jgi:hypothetical protein
MKRGTHGGKRPGAGRKSALAPAIRLEIAIDYRGRMHAASAAEAFSLDPVRQRRKKIFEEISVLIARRLTGKLSIEEQAGYDKMLRDRGGASFG